MNVTYKSGTEVTWRRKALVPTAFLAAAITLIPKTASLIAGRVLYGIGSVTLAEHALSLINVTFTRGLM